MAARRLCRFLLSSNPKPNRPNPDHGLGLRFPSAKARPFSTGAESGLRPHWATEYRRRLGIGDSLVRSPHMFLPEKDGDIKINFSAHLLMCTTKDGEHDDFGWIFAIARKSSGDVLGVTKGITKYKGGALLELSLYGLKAASNLAEELKRTSMHDGPVVYEPSNPLVAEYFHRDCEAEPEMLRKNMPRDEELDEACRSCTIYCGSREELMKMLPDHYAILL